SHLKALENQVGQITSSSERPMGKLSGKSEANPKEYVNALHLRSGRQLPYGDRIEDNANHVGE
ncbi:unnamed protein product, partial [Cochlearia groenlandica]